MLVLFIYCASGQFSSVTQLCPTLCDPMDYSTPGLPVHHQFLKLAQTHVHGVSDAIQPSHLLSFPCPPAFNLSQHQSLILRSQLLASGGQSIEVPSSASILSMNIQDWFPWEFLPWEPHEQYKKEKRYDTENLTPQVSTFPICYWRRVDPRKDGPR